MAQAPLAQAPPIQPPITRVNEYSAATYILGVLLHKHAPEINASDKDDFMITMPSVLCALTVEENTELLRIYQSVLDGQRDPSDRLTQTLDGEHKDQPPVVPVFSTGIHLEEIIDGRRQVLHILKMHHP